MGLQGSAPDVEGLVTDPACPSCGETERLSGVSLGGDIEVTCGSCGIQWHRGERRCSTCGGSESTTARQRMTTYPRGNQLAVIGMREVPLCPRCDSDAVAELGTDRLVDDDYSSRFVRSSADDGAHPSRRTPQPAASPAPSARARTTPRRGQLSEPTPRQRVADQRGDTPTVRKAVEAYLENASDAVSATAMLVLGRSLGSSTRLSEVTPQSGAQLTEAVDDQWAKQPNLRALAVDAINDAFRFWARRGWIATDRLPRVGEPG